MTAVGRVLEEAAKLVKAGWTRGAYARKVGGKKTHPCGPEASCFCAAGAIDRAARDHYPTRAHKLARSAKREVLHTLRSRGDWDSIILWNDKQPDKSAVLRALRQTAERLA